MKIPQFDTTNFDLPLNFDNGIVEIGIAESYLAEPIDTYIRKYEGQIRNTDSEKIALDELKFLFREGGFAVQGNVQVQVRKLLGENPITGALYTPWATIAASFIEELSVEVVDGRLNICHDQITLSTNDSWYKKLFDEFVVPYLKNEVVKQINEQLSNFNGMTLEELAVKYGQEKIQQKFGVNNIDTTKISTILKLVNTGANRFERIQRFKDNLSSMRVNARVSGKHLWLSLVKR